MDRSKGQIMAQTAFALIGMPCSGKSTIGACLAKRLQINFYDLDDVFESEHRSSAADYITTKGEEAFRLQESLLLRSFLISRQKPYVLACGGGTPCFHNNLEHLKNHCKLLFIDADLEVLLERIRREKHGILRGVTNEYQLEKLKEVREKRLPYYLESDQVITQNELNSPYLFTKALYLFTKDRNT